MLRSQRLSTRSPLLHGKQPEQGAEATIAERLARFRNTFQNPSVADLDFSLDGNEKPHRARPFTWARNRIIGHVFGVFLRDGFKVWFDLLTLP